MTAIIGFQSKKLAVLFLGDDFTNKPVNNRKTWTANDVQPLKYSPQIFAKYF